MFTSSWIPLTNNLLKKHTGPCPWIFKEHAFIHFTMRQVASICATLRHVASICVLPISRFLWALTDAYRTVPRKPAAPRGGLTSPDALVYWRARPKSWKSNFIAIVLNSSFYFFTHFTCKANDPEFFQFSSSESIIKITLIFRTLEWTKVYAVNTIMFKARMEDETKKFNSKQPVFKVEVCFYPYMSLGGGWVGGLKYSLPT